MLKALDDLLRAEIDPAFALRARFIFEEVEKTKPKKVLDAGCGRGFYVNSLSYYDFIKEIHGIDLNSTYLAIAKNNIIGNKRIFLKQSSIYTLPYPDNYFDFIICSEVIEHVDDKKAISEIYRVLKKGGKLIITVPNINFPFLWDPLNWLLMKIFNTHINKNIWWLAGIWADHERLYTENQIKKIVAATGFKIQHTEKVLYHCWAFSHFLLYGIGKNLVERFGLNSFNRFNITKKSILKKILSTIFMLPSLFLDRIFKSNPSVNIVLTVIK